MGLSHLEIQWNLGEKDITIRFFETDCHDLKTIFEEQQ